MTNITRPRPSTSDLLAEPPTVSLARACEYLGVSRSVGYNLAKNKQFPVTILRIGNSYRIPTAGLLNYLGITAVGSAPDQPTPEVMP